MPFPIRIALVLALSALACPSVDAQTAPHAAKSEAGSDRIVFDDRGGMSIKDFVRWVTDVLDRPIIFAPPAHAQLKETATTTPIRFNRTTTVARADVMKFALKTLFPHDLTIVDMSSKGMSYLLLESLRFPTVLKTYRRHVTAKELDDLRDTYVFVSFVMTLQHAEVQAIQSQIARIGMANTPVARAAIPLPSQNSVVLVGFAPEVESWRRLLNDLDVPAPAAAKKPGAPSRTDTSLRLRIKTLEVRMKRLEQALLALGHELPTKDEKDSKDDKKK